MKVLFPVQNDDVRKFTISDRMKNFVCIYDTVTHQIQWNSLSAEEVANNFTDAAKKLGVEGIVSLKDIDLFSVAESGIEIYKSATKDLISAIKLLNQNKLPLMA
ncbi:MAG: hypothetical protein M0P12_09630 [Paludibacteraceae bacterium]|nr:hypothetical protein [Paludibacteraceae bacterium]HOI27406.1 hypothetical protein [Paludibacteraceae bacterium]HPH63345.1 hypothetical protein [Paludibacteraceae bacterium]